MKKMLWSGTALVLMIATGLFMMGRYVAAHPDSFIGHCAMTIYHMWEPLLNPGGHPKPGLEIAERPEAAPAPAKSAQAAEIIEPIVVEPTDQEPPLAIPRLSPEITAAIERLRGEEESEAPPQPFDGPSQNLRMPYADEEVEVLPAPTPEALDEGLRIDINLPPSYGFFFLAPSCWQMVFDKALETIQQMPTRVHGGILPY